MKQSVCALCSLIPALTLEIHSEAEFFAVRLGFDIPPEEKEFLKKRKVVVAKTFKKILSLDFQPEPEKVECSYVVFTNFANKLQKTTTNNTIGQKSRQVKMQ